MKVPFQCFEHFHSLAKMIWLLILVGFCLPAMGQSDPHDINLFQNIGDSRNVYYGLLPKSSGTKGSPFIFDTMAKGDIIMANGKIYQGIYINILPENAEIFIRGEEEEDAKVVILENKKVGKIIYDDSERTFVPMKVEDKLQIVEIIVEREEGMLIALHHKRFNKATVGGGYNSGPKYDSYQHIVRYFLVNGSGQEEIRRNKSGLKALDNQNWKTLQNYIKSNKLNMNDPGTMKRIYLHALALQK